MKRNTTFQSKRAQIRIERLLALLADQMLPARAIAEHLHCDQSMATEYLRHLRAEPRRVRISGHEIVNGTKRALYGLGSAPDEPMTVMTNQERYAAVLACPDRLARRRELSRESHRRMRDAVPLEQRQRHRLRKDQIPDARILELLAECPGYTTVQLADKLGIGARSVHTSVKRLRQAGQVQRAQHGTGKSYQWEIPSRPLPAPLNIKPQSIFSALGI